jgi:EmrB/QacA subfamily drug resistance transporter
MARTGERGSGRPWRQAPAAPDSTRRWATLAALSLSSFLLLLGDTSLSVVLPAVRRDLGVGLGGLEWLVNSYTLALAVTLLPAGRACDRLGARRVFLGRLGIIPAASLAAGMMPSLPLLLAARVVQGAGAGLASPAALALISTNFDERRRGLALGLWTAAATSALAFGPLAGAAMEALGSWRLVLLVNGPLGVIVALAARRLLAVPGRAGRGFDVVGLATSAVGLSSLLYGLTNGAGWGWTSAAFVWSMSAAGAALALFVVVESRVRAPLLDLALFRRRGFAGANAVGLLVTAVMCSVFFFLSLFLQAVAGYSTLETGLLFLTMTVPLGLVAPFAGLIADRRGAKLPLVVGTVPVSAGLSLLAVTTSGVDVTALIVACVAIRVGMGLTTTPLTAAAVADLAVGETASGAAVVNTFRTVGLGARDRRDGSDRRGRNRWRPRRGDAAGPGAERGAGGRRRRCRRRDAPERSGGAASFDGSEAAPEYRALITSRVAFRPARGLAHGRGARTTSGAAGCRLGFGVGCHRSSVMDMYTRLELLHVCR